EEADAAHSWFDSLERTQSDRFAPSDILAAGPGMENDNESVSLYVKQRISIKLALARNLFPGKRELVVFG
ncbi:MAG: hypothetical protein JSV78_11615, partial [Phycisphaerales bacterium]